MFVNLILVGLVIFFVIMLFLERTMNRKRESELLNRLMSKNFAEYSLIVRNEQDGNKPLESSVAPSERGEE